MLIHSVGLLIAWPCLAICIVLAAVFFIVRKRSAVLAKSFLGGLIVVGVIGLVGAVLAIVNS